MLEAGFNGGEVGTTGTGMMGSRHFTCEPDKDVRRTVAQSMAFPLSVRVLSDI